MNYHPLRFISFAYQTLHILQVMGPEAISTTDSTTIKVTQLPKLASNGENWLTYQERVTNAATARGLCRHLVGTVLRPLDPVEKDGKFFLPGTITALADDALEKHK